MSILVYLIPICLILGGIGVMAFLWTIDSNQYDDPQGNASRILKPDYDDHPMK